MTISTIDLVLLIAATWRLSNLLANEDGPFHFIKTLRSKIARAEVKSRRKNGFISRLHLYEGVNCEYCNSIWFGIVLAALYRFTHPLDLVTTLILPLALSTGAIIIKHIVFLLKSADIRLDQLNNPKIETKIEKVEAIKQPVVNKWDALLKEQTLEKGGD